LDDGKNKSIDVGCVVKLCIKIDKIAFELLNAKTFSSIDVDALIYIQHYPKSFYIKHHNIIRVSHVQLTSIYKVLVN